MRILYPLKLKSDQFHYFQQDNCISVLSVLIFSQDNIFHNEASNLKLSISLTRSLINDISLKFQISRLFSFFVSQRIINPSFFFFSLFHTPLFRCLNEKLDK